MGFVKVLLSSRPKSALAGSCQSKHNRCCLGQIVLRSQWLAAQRASDGLQKSGFRWGRSSTGTERDATHHAIHPRSGRSGQSALHGCGSRADEEAGNATWRAGEGGEALRPCTPQIREAIANVRNLSESGKTLARVSVAWLTILHHQWSCDGSRAYIPGSTLFPSSGALLIVICTGGTRVGIEGYTVLSQSLHSPRRTSRR